MAGGAVFSRLDHLVPSRASGERDGGEGREDEGRCAPQGESAHDESFRFGSFRIFRIVKMENARFRDFPCKPPKPLLFYRIVHTAIRARDALIAESADVAA